MSSCSGGSINACIFNVDENKVVIQSASGQNWFATGSISIRIDNLRIDDDSSENGNDYEIVVRLIAGTSISVGHKFIMVKQHDNIGECLDLYLS